MSKTSGKFLVITERGAVVKEVPADDSLEAMQKAVGGYIELFLRMESGHRPGVQIDFYCNEEGRLNGLPLNVIVNAGRGYLFDIMGPLLIAACNPDGESIGMSKEELADLKVIRRQREYPEVRYGNVY